MGPEDPELLIVGWGSTAGAITSAVGSLQEEGLSVSHLHLKYLNPFPRNLEEVLRRAKRILIPELNMGQLQTLIRATFLIPSEGLHKVQGKPFKVTEIMDKAREVLNTEPVA